MAFIGQARERRKTAAAAAMGLGRPPDVVAPGGDPSTDTAGDAMDKRLRGRAATMMTGGGGLLNENLVSAKRSLMGG